MKHCTNRQCKREIPDSARHCPYCGQPQSGAHSLPYLLGGIVILAILVILVTRAYPSRRPASFVLETPQQRENKLIPTGTAVPTRRLPATSTIPRSTPTVVEPLLTSTRTMTRTPVSNLETCPGAPPPKVHVNDLVIVVTTDRDRLVLRSSPEIQERNEIQRLNTGTELKIFDGPNCVQDPATSIYYWFWYVRIRSSRTFGWVAEGDRSLYYLEVVQ